METSLYFVALLLNRFENPWLMVVLIAVGSVVLSLLKKQYGIIFLMVMGMTAGITQIIKSLTHIARPQDALVAISGYRFPSMHASLVAAAATTIVWYVWTHYASKKIRVLSLLLALCVVAGVSYTRLMLQVHEPIDVIAGSTLGIAISLAFHLVMRRYTVL